MKTVAVAIALLRREGRWFLQRRDPASGHLAGVWEFPGGKVEPGESPEAALRREMLEELSWAPGELHALDPITHAYPDRVVTLHPFLSEGPELPRTALAWGWFRAAEAARLRVPEANGPLLDLLGRMP
ncbi:MAG TPA: (deoxy)nucleoside triphosphate pyrophosphohydrolase [Holophagaceae bacterium]|nr:(deoxy)nucleoside triphosphate pyrophosphohydrolase [Holophagaceae bacterium]